MRSILVVLYMVLYAVVELIPALLLLLLRQIDRRRAAILAQYIVMYLGFRPILFLSGVKLTVKGRERIPKDQAALYAYNHKGFFDILAGYTTAPYPTAFIAKKEIQKVPLISQWMWFMNCVFLDRSDPKQGMDMIKQGAELLKGGTSVYIAPEGTRNKGDGVLEFHRASFMPAERAGCPVVPVAINNTDSVFEKHLPWIHRAHVIIEYCEPIDVQGMDRARKKELANIVHDILEEKVRKNSAEV